MYNSCKDIIIIHVYRRWKIKFVFPNQSLYYVITNDIRRGFPLNKKEFLCVIIPCMHV